MSSSYISCGVYTFKKAKSIHKKISCENVHQQITDSVEIEEMSHRASDSRLTIKKKDGKIPNIFLTDSVKALQIQSLEG